MSLNIFFFIYSAGKDKIVFLTPEDLQKPSTLTFPDEDEPAGLMLPNGDINWDCPCLGGMATGPCGVDFREAFSCFHYR
jgi:intermembrane space import and assembly protein 40